MRNEFAPRSLRRRLAIAGYGTVAAAGVMTTALIAGVTHTAEQSRTAATNRSASSSAYGSGDDDATTSTSNSSSRTTSSSSSTVDTAPQGSQAQGGSNGS
jgi:hypothetical protein